MADPTLVTAADIARIAGVSRGTVSNWRRRRPDFPEPVGGTAVSPAYDRAEVEQWLKDRGTLPELSPEEELWRRVVDSARGGDLGEKVRQVALGLSRTDDLVGLEPDFEMKSKAALESLIDRYADTMGIPVTSAPVADLMAVIGEPGGGVVLDLACGTGELLAAAIRNGAAAVRGQEIDEALAELAGCRMSLEGGGKESDIAIGDSLRDDRFSGLTADMVLCHPPFGSKDWGQEELLHDPRWQYGAPGKNDPELAWAQAALAHLRPGGRAVMLMPPALAARPSARRIRAEMVRQGVIRAIVSLPAGTVRPQHVPVHLWVLEPPAGDVDPRVLFVDAAQKPDETWEQAMDRILAAWGEFTAHDAREQPGVVRAIDLLDDDVDLTPLRYAARPDREMSPAETAARVARLQDRLREVLAQATGDLPETAWPASKSDPRWRVVTLADLHRTKVATLYRGAAKPEPVILQPGDVTLPAIATGPEVRAIVVTGQEAGEPLRENVHLVRPNPGQADPWFLAGFLVGRSSLRAAITGTNADRIDARRLKVPLLPLTEQRRYGAAFQKLRESEIVARKVAAVTAELTELIRNGLTEGAMIPSDEQNT